MAWVPSDSKSCQAIRRSISFSFRMVMGLDCLKAVITCSVSVCWLFLLVLCLFKLLSIPSRHGRASPIIALEVLLWSVPYGLVDGRRFPGKCVLFSYFGLPRHYSWFR